VGGVKEKPLREGGNQRILIPDLSEIRTENKNLIIIERFCWGLIKNEEVPT